MSPYLCDYRKGSSSQQAFQSVIEKWKNVLDKKRDRRAVLMDLSELITEFEAKANIFNEYFASQCTTINNNSVLHSTLNHLTDDKLSSFNISSEVIFQLIKNLDPNKAHGYDENSVKMLNLCGLSIYKPLTYFTL